MGRRIRRRIMTRSYLLALTCSDEPWRICFNITSQPSLYVVVLMQKTLRSYIPDRRHRNVQSSIHISSAIHRSIERTHANLHRLDRFTPCQLRRPISKLHLWLNTEIYQLCHLRAALQLTTGPSASRFSLPLSDDNGPPRFSDFLALYHARLCRQLPSTS